MSASGSTRLSDRFQARRSAADAEGAAPGAAEGEAGRVTAPVYVLDEAFTPSRRYGSGEQLSGVSRSVQLQVGVSDLQVNLGVLGAA